VPRWVHISEGPTPTESEDLVVIQDPGLIRDIGVLTARTLGSAIPAPRAPTRATVVPLPAKPDSGAE
jgi:hypothetical protein